MHAPHNTHLFATKCILRHLQGTTDHGIMLCSAVVQSIVVAYSNADWAGCHDSCRSTIGYAVFFGPNLIVWRAKNQPTVSKSSLKLSIEQLSIQLPKPFGSANYFTIFTSLSPLRSRFILIMSLQPISLPILSIMTGASIL